MACLNRHWLWMALGIAGAAAIGANYPEWTAPFGVCAVGLLLPQALATLPDAWRQRVVIPYIITEGARHAAAQASKAAGSRNSSRAGASAPGVSGSGHPCRSDSRADYGTPAR